MIFVANQRIAIFEGGTAQQLRSSVLGRGDLPE